MTNLEIDKALALAIGWKELQIKVTDAVFVWRGYWCIFDHTDWTVIGPIATRYDCFPMHGVTDALWHSWSVGNVATVNAYAETPQKAIALAAIEGAKK